MIKNLHKGLLEEGWEKLLIDKDPRIYISYKKEIPHLYNKNNKGEDTLICEKPINCFRILSGREIPEAKTKGIDRKEFEESFVVYGKYVE